MREWNEQGNPPDELPAGSIVPGDLLRHKDARVRLNAARQLIAANGAGPANTADSLARLLHDDDHAVRVTAAHGLIGLREKAVRPLLESLARDVQSVTLRGSAHRVLLALYEQGCLNSAETLVLHALEGPDPAAHVARALPAALHPVTPIK